MKKIALALFLVLPGLAAQAAPPKVKAIYPTTLENQSPYGDSIKIVFEAAIHNGSAADPRIVSSVSIPSAPAGYAETGNGLSARNAAKNYKITITPGPGSATLARSATWYELGGIAVYDGYDPQKSTVHLKLTNSTGLDLFKPEDIVKVEILTNITNLNGEVITPLRFSTQKIAS